MMDDLISRRAALEAILNCSDIFINNKPVMIDKVDAQEALMELPTAEPKKGKWIPCSERLPSEGENVLLCDTLFGNVAIGRLIRYNISCCWEVDHWDCDIEDWQAWMPLPEPYNRADMRGEE